MIRVVAAPEAYREAALSRQVMGADRIATSPHLFYIYIVPILYSTNHLFGETFFIQLLLKFLSVLHHNVIYLLSPVPFPFLPDFFFF